MQFLGVNRTRYFCGMGPFPVDSLTTTNYNLIIYISVLYLQSQALFSNIEWKQKLRFTQSFNAKKKGEHDAQEIDSPNVSCGLSRFSYCGDNPTHLVRLGEAAFKI